MKKIIKKILLINPIILAILWVITFRYALKEAIGNVFNAALETTISSSSQAYYSFWNSYN